MLGAAPRRTAPFARAVVTAVSVGLMGLGALSVAAPAGAVSGPHLRLARTIWALPLPWSNQLHPGLLTSLKAGGVHAVVIRRGRWTDHAHARLVTEASRAGVVVIEPRAIPSAWAEKRALLDACRRRWSVVDRCAVRATSVGQAKRFAALSVVDFVLVAVPTVDALKQVSARMSTRTRIMGELAWHGTSGDADQAWAARVRAAASGHDAAVEVAAPAIPRTLEAYFGIIGGDAKQPASAPPSAGATAAGPGSTTSPGTTATTTPTAATTTSPASTSSAGSPKAAAGTSSGGGSSSSGSSSGGSSSAGTGSGSVADLLPPTAPLGVAAGAVTATSITLSWTTATDNIGVAGYSIYANGARVASTSGTSFVLGGLTCGTTYSIGVDAYDAAGNRSTITTVNAAMQACASAAAASANVYVAVNGNDSTCVRGDATKPCATASRAYAIARLGDTVQIGGGTYTTSWNFKASDMKTGPDGTCDYATGNYSNCVTFVPAPNANVVINPTASLTQAAIWICASFIRIEDVTITDTLSQPDSYGDRVSAAAVQVGKTDSSCVSGTTPPHDVVLERLTYGGPASIQGGAYNTWLVGGTAASTTDVGWYVGGPAPAQGAGFFGGNYTDTVHASGIVGVTFDGFAFVDGDSLHHHMECLHVDGAAHDFTIARSIFAGCPTYAIRFEAEGSGGFMKNLLIENNWFDGQRVNWDCHDNTCQVTGNVFRFNTVGTSTLEITNDCALVQGNTCTMSGNSAYGNLGGTCPGVAGWTFTYGIYTAANVNGCATATNTFGAAVAFVSEGAPNYNLALTGTQTATGYVPSSVGWPATNITGVARSGAATNAGAS